MTRGRVVGEPGKYLAYEESGRYVVVAISREWTRIGRSLAADVRFDDATVSRRHALVVNQAEGVRVLDDRSLNGISVNGRRVEWSPLTDGDEITVGRHTLFYLDTVSVARAGRRRNHRVANAQPDGRYRGRPLWQRRSRSCRSRAARARPPP